MSVNAETLRRLAALRLSRAAMAEVLAIIADLQTVEEARKSKDRERKIRGKSKETPRKIQDAKGSDGSPNDITLTPSLPPKTKPTLRSGLERARARTRLGEVETKFNLEFARQAGMDSRQIDIEFDQFCDHHRKLGSLMADWQAAWRTWVRNAIKFQARAGPAGRSNGVRGFLENVAQMMADGNDSRTENGNGGSHEGFLGLPERRG